MTDADTIAQLRRDVDVLTGLVIGLVSSAEMRARVAVRNHDAAGEGTVMSLIALSELAMQQSLVLRLENQDRSGLTGATEIGYDALLARLNDAVGDYALPVMRETALAA
jgi:hypothetical protein